MERLVDALHIALEGRAATTEGVLGSRSIVRAGITGEVREGGYRSRDRRISIEGATHGNIR
jgi:hypothetical protein